MTSRWVDELVSTTSSTVLCNESMKRYTTLHIGGPADVYIEVGSVAELARLCCFCKRRHIPILTIGDGSKLLFQDSGFRGVVVKLMGEFLQFNVDGYMIVSGAGVPLSVLLTKAVAVGLSGLEFAAGIPGTVGGAVATNAGRYGLSMADVIESVEILADDCTTKWLDSSSLGFGYRSCSMPDQAVVTRVKLHLAESDCISVAKLTSRVMEEKQAAEPLAADSAGCVFKSPLGANVWKLIDECGFRGMCIGGAQVSIQHANFIVNTGEATATDILDLVDVIRLGVREQTGVDLELELRVV